MTSPIKSVLLSVVIGLLLTVNTAAQETFSQAELAGAYYSGHRFAGSSITLNENGTYSDNASGCTYKTEESGTFVVSGGAVRFRMLKYVGRSHGDGPDVDLFDNQARKEFFGYGNREIPPLQTEYTLQPVKWGKRIYLIDGKSFDDFANAINLGLEPRGDVMSEPYYGSFYLRDGDEQKGVSGMPLLPREWLTFLLKKPVRAMVVGVYGNERETIALIDKGSRSGLKVGMRFIREDEEPFPWSDAELISVEETFARIRVGRELKVGDKLTTKYKRKDLKY